MIYLLSDKQGNLQGGPAILIIMFGPLNGLTKHYLSLSIIVEGS
jgi:hypothetical protein